MPRNTRSKLANPSAPSSSRNGAKHRKTNGKKRLTGQSLRKVRATHARRAETAGNARSGRTGTAGAIIDKDPSAPIIEPTAEPKPAKPRRREGRKIGRNTLARPSKVERSRRGRRSDCLRLAEVCNIMAAADYTAKNTVPLNRHTTIHFDKCGIADPVTALRSYMKLARDWLRTQGAPFAYIWVRESGEDKGEHAHVLMHVPPQLVGAFAKLERGWRVRIGAKRAKGAFETRPVGRSYRHCQLGVQYGEHYADHLQTIVGYVVKGAEQKAVKSLGLTKVQPGGELWGKRTGMSEGINRTARGRALLK